jgi:hypothetical protein
LICGEQQKARQHGRRRAFLLLLISLADLHQAITVRRHGISMMVVMAVMVAELHLPFTLKGNPVCCQPKAADSVAEGVRL